MKPLDYLKAIGVAVASLAFTIIASFPMVAFYAFFIEPGHPQEFYTEAAQWIAPWSSYILGPIAFFVLNYWLAKRSPERNAIAFAAASIVAYLVIDLSIVPAMGGDIFAFLTFSMGFWFSIKVLGALSGAHLGQRRAQAAGIGAGST